MVRNDSPPGSNLEHHPCITGLAMKKIFTILVADKNRNVRDFLRRELSAEGYNVAVARDGGEILAEIDREDGVDLLVFDLEMPDADSSKIFEKSQNRRPPLPVVIHTFLTENPSGILARTKGKSTSKRAAISNTLRQPSPICSIDFTRTSLLMPDRPRHGSWSPSGT